MAQKPFVGEILIPSVASIIVAIITTFGTIRVAETGLSRATEQVEKLQSEVSQASQRLETGGVPMGTVVASLLPFGAFTEASGDSKVFDSTKSAWAPADGREVFGSKYQKLTGQQKVPDLRGLFLRGLNAGRTDEWRDPDGDREPGSRQVDSTKLPNSGFTMSNAGSHSHTFPATGAEGGWGQAEIGGGNDSPLSTAASGDHSHSVAGGDPETRPRNAGVYYYVKIN